MPKYGDRIFSRHTVPPIARCKSMYGEEIFFWSGLIEWIEIKVFEKYGMFRGIDPRMHCLQEWTIGISIDKAIVICFIIACPSLCKSYKMIFHGQFTIFIGIMNISENARMEIIRFESVDDFLIESSIYLGRIVLESVFDF